MNRKKPYSTGTSALLLVGVEVVFWGLMVAAYFTAKKFSPNISLHHASWWPLVFIVPVCMALFLVHLNWRNRALKQLADFHLLPAVAPGIGPMRATGKFLLWRFALAFIVIGFLDPKVGSRLEEVETKGIDLMIAIDVSNSMKAEDIKPNRLELAKRTVHRLINQLTGDRIGIVIFAGDAYTQLPITNDIQAAKVFLDAVETGSVPKQGTAIGAAIDLCVDSFDPKSEAGKAILVITDGENHEDDAVGAASSASSKGITVSCIGMGTTTGAPIPQYNQGNRTFKTDVQGNTIVSSMNEQMMIDLVTAGNGTYIPAQESFVQLNPLFDEFSNMTEADLGVASYTDYEHRFPIFFGIALIALVAEMLLNDKKRNAHG